MTATVILDGGIEQGNVPLDGTGHGLAVLLPQGCGAFDIREEKGDGVGGEIGHDPFPYVRSVLFQPDCRMGGNRTEAEKRTVR
jgi:hypothetical protein